MNLRNTPDFDALPWEDQVFEAICHAIVDKSDCELRGEDRNSHQNTIIFWKKPDDQTEKVGYRIHQNPTEVLHCLHRFQIMQAKSMSASPREKRKEGDTKS